jgi:hypothetical protein
LFLLDELLEPACFFTVSGLDTTIVVARVASNTETTSLKLRSSVSGRSGETTRSLTLM